MSQGAEVELALSKTFAQLAELESSTQVMRNRFLGKATPHLMK